MFFDQIEKIYCINLLSRPDRWGRVQQEFSKVGILDRVERFEALIGTGTHDYQISQNGCKLSHKAIHRMALENKYKNYLIFEDDVCFVDEVPDLIIPEDYAVFYLGFYLSNTDNPFSIAQDNRFLKLHGRCHGHHAVVFNGKFSDVILQGVMSNDQMDVFCSNFIMRYHPVYSFNPPIAFQTGVKSNLRPNPLKDWQDIAIRRLNIYCNCIGAKQSKLICF